MRSRPLDYYKALYQIATDVDSGTSTKDVLNGIVRSTAKSIGLKGCSLMLLSKDRKRLVHTVAYGLSSSYIRKGSVKIDPITDEALKGNPIIVYDATTDPRIQYKAQAKEEGIASILSMPMVLREEVIGILRVYTSEPRDFTTEDIEFLNLVAALGAISLRKAREYESQEQYYEKRLQEKIAQLEQSQEDLAKVEEAKDKVLAFISMVAHDLKAPLAAIQTYFGVMLGGYTGELNEKHQELIEKSSARLDGLLEFISDLLDISRIETGQIINEMETVSLVEITDELLEDIERLAEHKGLKLVTEIPPDLPPIHGSSLRLQQVLTNLLSNAIKFTAEGGTVNLQLISRNGEIIGEVQDDGIGIPSEDLPHIFEDFYRAANVDAPGSGLGLPIAKRIIEAHGGEVKAISPCPETSRGCKFTFSIPIK